MQNHYNTKYMTYGARIKKPVRKVYTYFIDKSQNDRYIGNKKKGFCFQI